LVVDDDPSVRELLQAVLKGAGYQVLTAADGQEALARLSVVVPDMIISDGMMPVMDGPELFRIVKRDPLLGRIPYVVVSGAQNRRIKEQLFHGLIDAFLIKPFDNGEVLRTVERFLRTIRLMVVEDDPDVRQMLGAALAAQDIDVRTVEDGRAALERLCGERADVLFVDTEMPGIDGPSLVRILRGTQPPPEERFERVCAEYCAVPILMTSGSQTADSLPADLRAEIDGFIPKPYDVGELAARIRGILGGAPV
jgi:CheY-like chemotaxis protein